MIDATDIHPSAVPYLDLVREIQGLEQATWPDVRARIPAWHPRNEDDDDGGSGSDDDAKGKTGGDNDDAKGKSGSDDDQGTKKDDDEADDRVSRAERAAAAANRELREIKRQQAEADTKSKAEAGKWKELYEEAQGKLDKLEESVQTSTRERLAVAALTVAKALNPERAVKLLDLDEIEDKADAERAVRALTKTDKYLFEATGTRQKRGAGGTNDEDEDDDRDGRKPKRQAVSRLRRGLEATAGDRRT